MAESQLAASTTSEAVPTTRTFLFADLRDYTAFVELHGDRAAAALVAAYRQLVRRRIEESAGAEIKVEGDAVFVVFPSARQAIKCGASILGDAAEHTTAQPGLPMRVGIGLHAGEPVSQAGDFIGSAVNVAARIGAAAAAGQLLISDVVRGLVRTDPPFPLRDRGPVILKGLSEPVHLYEVAWGGQPHVDSAALLEGSLLPTPQLPRITTSASPLIGRAADVETLRACIDTLKRGQGSTILLAGEAGIGKSRLLREAFFAQPRSHALLYGACGLAEAPPPYEPINAIIRSITHAPDGEAALRRVAPELLALAPESAPSGQQAPDRDHLFGAFLRMVRQYARVSPTVLIVEDLHWADEGTLAIVHFLAEQAEPTPYLLVGTYRSDELHRRHRLRPVLVALNRRAQASTITLTPLPTPESLQLLRSLAPLAGAAPAEVVAISQRAEGNPLFLEELAQHHQLGRNVVPASLAETVLQRTNRAGDTAARLLSYLAVTGVRANYDVLEQLMGSEPDLLTGARAAIEQGLVVEEGQGLAFRHALTREAILGDLMARERRALHREVGETIERLHGAEPDQAGAIAEHFGSAGLHDRALPFVMRAGQRALLLHAPDEAARNFERAVEWSAAGSRERMLALEGLGRAYYRLLHGRKAVSTYEEALEIARKVGAPDDIARLTMFHTFAMPWGRDEYAGWKASWDAAEPLGNAGNLARIATGLARRAHLYFEDGQAAIWLERGLTESRRAGSREAEVRALRLQAQFQHEPGWQAEEEHLVREQLELALARDDGVLDVHADLLARRCRESDEAEREGTLQSGRAYAERRGIPPDLAFRHGVVWVNWLTGNWQAARALWDEVRARWSEDAPDIYPGAGPIASAIDLEILGPDTARERLLQATAPMRKSETWRGLLAAAAHEANLWLAENDPQRVLENILPILEKRPPGMLDMESFALTTRVVLPAALLTKDRRALTLWTDDPAVAAGGVFHRTAVDQARAVAALLAGDPRTADSLFAAAAGASLQRGWRLLAHELAWQRRQTGVAASADAVAAALTFYRDAGAGWRVAWLEQQ